MSKLLCPNCGKPVSEGNHGCALHDLINVVRERGNVSERKLRKLHATADADWFWEQVGAIVDRLEDGHFSH